VASTFDIGNVYSEASGNSKTYYVAVSETTLVTYRNGTFGTYTTRRKHHSLEHISVKKLCKTWRISVDYLDHQMSRYFSPDDEAVERARRDKDAEKEAALELVTTD